MKKIVSLSKDVENLRKEIEDIKENQLDIFKLESKINKNLKWFLSVCLLVAQSCPTLCSPTNCSPPGFSVHVILQARILECIVIPFNYSVLNPPGEKKMLIQSLIMSVFSFPCIQPPARQ